MRTSLSVLLIVTVIFAGGYFYYTAEAICNAPIAYRIGVLDSQFGLSMDEARTAVADAESLWEDTTGRNLFTYKEDADFTINFIFDTRQELTNTEQEIEQTLEQQRDMSEAVRAQYDVLVAQYEDLVSSYETAKIEYENRLTAYNQEVVKWNREGGAPQSIYDDLEREQASLTVEQQKLNNTAHELNQSVRDINALSEKGSVVVSAYNNVVNFYNKTFGVEREFTQGDYQGDFINIYQYDDGEELRLVLAHEFGHALSLGHVENETSIMYYLMGEQDFEKGLTAEDKEKFQQVCGEGHFTLWPARW